MTLSYLSIALLLLQFVNKLVDWGRAQINYDKELDRQIAEQSAAILAKSEFAHEALKSISAMSDSDVDELLHSLEPPSGGG